MRVFLSWSGERSKRVAESLREWLPRVLQSIRPWMSSTDITPGSNWSVALKEGLSDAKAGIVCVTRDNVNNPWSMFEAGVLYHRIGENLVCPYLLDLSPAELEGPLAQLQALEANEEGTLKLIRTLNDALPGSLLSNEDLAPTAGVWWPYLEGNLKQIPEDKPTGPPSRTQKDLLEEILLVARSLKMANLQTNLFGGVEHVERRLADLERSLVRIEDILGTQARYQDELASRTASAKGFRPAGLKGPLRFAGGGGSKGSWGPREE